MHHQWTRKRKGKVKHHIRECDPFVPHLDHSRPSLRFSPVLWEGECLSNNQQPNSEQTGECRRDGEGDMPPRHNKSPQANSHRRSRFLGAASGGWIGERPPDQEARPVTWARAPHPIPIPSGFLAEERESLPCARSTAPDQDEFVYGASGLPTSTLYRFLRTLFPNSQYTYKKLYRKITLKSHISLFIYDFLLILRASLVSKKNCPRISHRIHKHTIKVLNVV